MELLMESLSHSPVALFSDVEKAGTAGSNQEQSGQLTYVLKRCYDTA